MTAGPNPYPPHSPTPPYRAARRTTAWVLYAIIAPTTAFVLFHLARGTLALLHSVWFVLTT